MSDLPPGLLLVDQTPFDLRVARVEGDEVVRLAYHHPARKAPLRGMLYRAKVTQIDKRLGAAFLSLGAAEGFLRRGGNLPRVGETILVEIKREGIGTKGVDVSDKPVLRLPRVTMPVGSTTRPGPIAPAAENDLDALAAAVPLDGDDKTPGPVAGLSPLAVLVARLADGGIDAVHVTSPALQHALLPLVGDEVDVQVVDAAPVRAALDAAEEEGLDPNLDLAGGGRLKVEETEALFAVDLDLGRQQGQSQKGAADRLLTDALAALSRYAKLADIGGQIIVDVPRAAIAAPKIIRDRLTRTFRPLGRVGVPAVSPEGVCVVIAPRPGPSLLERLTEPCAAQVRDGRRYRADVAAARAYRLAEATLAAQRTAQPCLQVSERIAPFFTDAALSPLHAQYGPRLTVTPDWRPNGAQEDAHVA